MITSLVRMYEKGAITADHLVAQCIQMIDPDDPGLVLSDLPNSILDRMLAYTRRYQPDRMKSTYGNPPATDQVEAARSWIEDLQAMQGGRRRRPPRQIGISTRWRRGFLGILGVHRRPWTTLHRVLADDLPDCHRVREEARVGRSSRWGPTRRDRGRETRVDHLHGESAFEADQGGQDRAESRCSSCIPPTRSP